MFRLYSLVILFLCPLHLKAQIVVRQDNPGIDTLHVVFHKDDWAIAHKVIQGETLFMLSKKFHVPPALLADRNDLDFQATLNGGDILYVPYGPFNQAKTVTKNRFDVRPLYYTVRKYDNLYRLAHLAGVQQKTIQGWNGLPDNNLVEGRRLFVGWVLYDSISNRQLNNVSKTGRLKSRYETKKEDKYTTVTIIKKAKPADTTSIIEKKYKEQTKDELVVTEEKGTAVFYANKGKLTTTNTFFAFHNTARPGTVIKVYNPGTDKTVFVKVLGAIPNTKMYHNSIIGISAGAKAALLVTEDKAWCELQYAP